MPAPSLRVCLTSLPPLLSAQSQTSRIRDSRVESTSGSLQLR